MAKRETAVKIRVTVDTSKPEEGRFKACVSGPKDVLEFLDYGDNDGGYGMKRCYTGTSAHAALRKMIDKWSRSGFME